MRAGPIGPALNTLRVPGWRSGNKRRLEMAWGKSEEKKEEKTIGTPGASRGGRDAAIDLAVSSIEKQFGKGSIMRLGEDHKPPEVQVVSTGSLALDIALGAGGLPRGRVCEIYGPESS